MNAYPRRWREVYGEELLGVLADVGRDGGGSPRRLPRTEVVALLRAGWALRWREHPPFWRWVAYRVFDTRLPERYGWWVADDIRSPWFPVIQSLCAVGAMVGVFTVFQLSGDPGANLGPTFWIPYIVVFAGATYLGRGYRRRRAWTKHIVNGRVPETTRPQEP